MECRTVTELPRRCWAAGSEKGCALVLEQVEGSVEDLARVGVTLALHLLHPFVPDRLARKLGPARKLLGRNGVAVELVVSGFGALDHALLRRVEEIPAQNFAPARPLTLMIALRTSCGRLCHFCLLAHSEKYAT